MLKDYLFCKDLLIKKLIMQASLVRICGFNLLNLRKQFIYLSK